MSFHKPLAMHLDSFALLFNEFPFGNPLLGNQNSPEGSNVGEQSALELHWVVTFLLLGKS